MDVCLDWGIKEQEFWSMSIAEISRYVESAKRLEEKRLKEKAYFDFTLASHISALIGRMFNETETEKPDITEIYPFFEEEAVAIQKKKEEQKQEAFIAQLMAFSQQHNKKMEEVE